MKLWNDCVHQCLFKIFKFKIFSALIILIIQFNNLQKQTNNCVYMIEPGCTQVIILLNEGGPENPKC